MSKKKFTKEEIVTLFIQTAQEWNIPISYTEEELKKMNLNKLKTVINETFENVSGEPCVMGKTEAEKFWKKFGSKKQVKKLDDKFAIVYGDIPCILVKNSSASLVDIGMALTYARKNGFPSCKYDKEKGRIFLTVPSSHDMELWKERGDNPPTYSDEFLKMLVEKLNKDMDSPSNDAEKAGIYICNELDETGHENDSINFGIMSSAISPSVMRNSPALMRFKERVSNLSENISELQIERWQMEAYREFAEERELAGDDIPWKMILGV